MSEICWKLEEPNEADQSLFPCFKLGEFILPKLISQEALDRIKNLKVRHNDIFLCSYPRSGTHWLAYIISLIVHNGKLPEGSRQGLFDSAKYMTGRKWTDEDFDAMKDPRILYDHLPYKYFMSIGNKNSKHIYIARNPKEVAISNYKLSIENKHGSLLFGFNGNWDEYLDCFIKGKTYYGSWMKHVSEWWKHRDNENVLFLWYEDLLKDPTVMIKKISAFLGYALSNELVENICKKASFEEMKTDKDAKVANFLSLQPSAFYRSGTNKSWREVFTKEQHAKMDELLLEAKYLKWNINFS